MQGAKIEFRGIEDDGDHWSVQFVYLVNDRIWLSAYVPVPKTVDDDKILSAGRHIFHEISRTATSMTSDWRLTSPEKDRQAA